MQDGSSEPSGRRRAAGDDPRLVCEHHRYAVASRYARGRRVLDLGCGEGRGSALLAAEADEVVGVDDADTVEHARAAHGGRRVEFQAGAVTDPELLAEQRPFDVIVCFHVLERVEDHESVLDAIRSRLAPGGLVLISTPDAAAGETGDTASAEEGGAVDPARRLTAPDFGSLLEGAFRHVAVLQQNPAAGSLVVPSDPGDPDAAIEGVRLQTAQRTATGWQVRQGLPHTGLIGFASDRQLPKLPAAAVLLDPELELVRGGADEAAGLRADCAEAEQRAERAEQRAERAEEQVQWLRDTAARLEGRAAAAQSRVAEVAAELTAREAEQQQRSALVRRAVDRVAPGGTRRRDLVDGALRHLPGAGGAVTGGGPSGGPGPAGGGSGPVDVPRSRNPQVSVIVPAGGAWARTRERLRLLAGHVVSAPFEVIVVDDGASEETTRRLAECGGVRAVRGERPLGFAGACGLGAEHARGEFLLFLTGGVTESWLDGLVDVLRADGGVGLVGAALLAPDGRLRQAGGVVFSDGTAHSPGSGADEDPVSGVLRDVDYCSGAALLVRAELFRHLGGFDARFTSADYAGADLSFAARAAGFRTVVQPRAAVVQHAQDRAAGDLGAPEVGAQDAGGWDRAAGDVGDTGAQEPGAAQPRGEQDRAQRLEHDRAAFAGKWAEVLEREHLAGSGARDLWLARQRGTHGHHGPVVLVAGERVPRPGVDAGARRMRGLLEQLREFGCRVVFLPDDHGTPEPDTGELRQLGVLVLPRAAAQQAFLREVGTEVALAVLSRSRATWALLEQLRTSAPGAVVVHDAVEPSFLGLRRRAELASELGDADAASALRRRSAAARERELAAVRAADAVLVAGAAHRRALTGEAPEPEVHVLSTVQGIESVQDDPGDREGVLLAGDFTEEDTVDAARWAVEQIMPLVWRRFPEVRLDIVGTGPAGEVRDLEQPGVAVHELSGELARWCARARVTLAPLRFGTGAAEVVGASLACGVPVVGTGIAPEGLLLGDGEGIRVGGTPAELAEAAVRLLADGAEWREFSRAGQEAVAEQCGPEAHRAAVRGLLELGKILAER
ncbi:hypothetical protein GCM10027174_11940 [Salinifilum aidingensis]